MTTAHAVDISRMEQPSAEDFAFSRLLSYAAYQWPSYQIGQHHRTIAEHLEKVESGQIKRLMITMPPRHGKSMLASEYFPAWYLGRNPSHYVIAASYSQDLADDFGRKVRNQLAGNDFKSVFPGVELSQDSTSSKRFSTTDNGSYFAVGVGGPVTGRGAHLLLIDDPVKNREDADSEVKRKAAKDWYTSTAYTRLMPGGRIVVIQCLVGDTRITMGDGTNRLLGDIRPGDMVMSYDADGFRSAKVLNWANQGRDCTFTIRTKSGRIVRANRRHPFLVQTNEGQEWKRLQDLVVGELLVGVTGGSGVGLSANTKGAPNQPRAKGTAAHTTTKQSGQVGIVPLLSILRRTGKHISSTDMASLLRSTIKFLQSKVGAALCAVNTHLRQILVPTGMGNYALTTAMTQGRSGDCYATTVTLPSDMGKQKQFCYEQRNTYELTTDMVVDIVESGYEEVFDIQVEGTESFIANGLVSHNTRWHEDDLSGWLLEEHDHEGWVVLNLPAIKDDQALWPEQYPLERLLEIKKTIGNRDWSALYQQEPAPETGDYFRREWVRYYDKAPESLTVYGASDYAVTDAGGDYTVHGVMGVDQHDNIYLLDWWRGQKDSAVWIDALLSLISRWTPVEWAEESGQIAKSLGPFIDKRQREEAAHCYRKQYISAHDKATRAQSIRGRMSQGRVYFPRTEWADQLVSEMLMFPQGKHDDGVDVLSLFGRMLSEMSAPAEKKTKNYKPVSWMG